MKFLIVATILSIVSCTVILDKDGTKPMETVTEKTFFDVTIGGKSIGRLTFGLFGDACPKTVKNFYAISQGTHYKDAEKKQRMTYTGNIFHRVIPGFMAQGGDIDSQNGRGGESIYGKTFPDENLNLKFSQPFLLAMANAGPDTNGSQFFITFKKTEWLNGKHVIFG